MPHKVIDARFHGLIDEFAPVDRVGRGFLFTEGPVWNPVEQNLLFSDMPGDVRRRWTPDGVVAEVQRPSNKGNGMTYDAELNLLVCEHSTSSVVRIRPDGTREVLCSHFEGKELNSPNDICVKSDGAIYFTDPTYGRMEGFGVKREQELSFQGVYMLPPQHRPGDEPVLVSDRYMFSQPNGLTFSPCERFMWVNDTEQANIRVFDVADDGRLAGGRLFATGIAENARAGRPDGMRSDTEGNVWVTAPGGVWVYSFDGVKLGEISCPEQVANFHWGGERWDTLFMCATTSLYTVRTKARPRREPFMAGGAAPAAAPAAARPVASGLDPKTTALLIQDMQNDVIMDGGAFADSGAPDHARQQNVIENSKRLAQACRRAGIMVIHVWFVCEPGHPAIRRNAPLFEGLIDADALVRGTWGVQPVPGLERQGADLVCEKMSMSAWETSRLESYLRHGGIETIIDTGAWTNMSIEHTARTAADKGFRVLVPEDACSSMNADWHRASLDYAMANVATITTVDEVLRMLPG
ncbi:isochorismatase family protein [Pikeienuella piscinae]|uniref:Isochorismatase family protein n=1 Tax=Pikeienuella piscinae TaxID=2748098 RepID=A0A7L5BWH4_9RHOB|nr:isochorismatase family protein [Pikeienuella piscinae]QIE55791.1 isochorismatase family protein [Pikeienuella piscinae]